MRGFSLDRPKIIWEINTLGKGAREIIGNLLSKITEPLALFWKGFRCLEKSI